MNSKPGNQKQPVPRRLPSFPHLNPNPIIGVNAHGRITFLNTGAVCALECIGKDASPEVFLPKDMNEILGALKRRERATFRREVTVGDWVFDESIYVAPEHASVGIYAVDITERKLAEEKAEQLSRFPEENPDPILRILSDGTPAYANRSSKLLLSVLKSKPDAPLPEAWLERIRNALSDGRQHEFEETCGSTVYSLLMVPVTGKGYVSVYGRDVTKRMQAEGALRESESRFRQLSDSLPQLVWTCLPDGPCDHQSEQWLRYTGIPAQQQLGFGWLEQLHPEDREPTVTAWNAAVAANSDFQVEFRIRRHDGEYRWFDTRAVRLCDADGRTAKWLVSSTDITEHKQTEERHERLTRNLSQNNEELKQLVYAASHDLRTPMVSVQGFVSELRIALDELMKMLQDPGIPPAVMERTAALIEQDIPESLKFVEAGVTRMSMLLSGLLRLARLDRAALVVEELDMNRVAGDVLAAAEFQIKEAGASFEVARLPSCFADGVMTGRLLANLVDNAIKYRDPARPLVVKIFGQRVRAESVYCVADNGVGIAPGLHAKVFELFYRVSPKQGTGDGLGLTIIKRIADRLGGRVWVESEPGNGTRFFFALPASRPAV